MKKYFFLVMTLSLVFTLTAVAQNSKNSEEEEAKGVIQRFSKNKLPITVELSLKKTEKGCDRFSTQVSNEIGRAHV